MAKTGPLVAVLVLLSLPAGGALVGGTAGTADAATTAGATQASFADGGIEEARGDVAAIPVRFDGAESGVRATVGIASGDGEYVTNVTVADANGDGTVVLEFNTYNAGTGIRDRVFSARGRDEVVSWRGERGEFVTALRERHGLGDAARGYARRGSLRAGQYRLQVVAHEEGEPVRNVSATTNASVERPDDSGRLTLTRRRDANGTVRVAPAGTSIDSIAEATAMKGSTLTRSEVAAEDEVLVHEITAPGLEGILRNRTERGANATAAFLAEEGGPGSVGTVWNASVAEAEGPTMRPPFEVDFDTSNSAVLADFENDTYYLALRLANAPRDFFFGGDRWNARFAVNDYDPPGSVLRGREGDAVVSRWVFEDASAPLRTLGDDSLILWNRSTHVLPNAAGVTVAPGTDLSLRIDYSDPITGAANRTVETTVRRNRTFAFEIGLRGVDAGTEFLATVRRNGEPVSPTATYRGRVEAVPEARVSFADQRVRETARVVTVSSASLSHGGFVTLRERNASGDVVGVSSALEPGFHDEIRVLIDRDVANGTTLVAVPHLDTDGSGGFEFDPDDARTGEVPRGEDGLYPGPDGESRVADSATLSVAQGSPTVRLSEMSPAATAVNRTDVVDVSATVENTGSEAETQVLELRIADETVDSTRVTLEPGVTRTVTFENVSTESLTPGTYTLSISGDDDGVTGALGIDPRPTPMPTASETPTDSRRRSPTSVSSPSRTDARTASSTAAGSTVPTPADAGTAVATDEVTSAETTTSDGGPGFGLGLGVVALLAAGVSRMRQRE